MVVRNHRGVAPMAATSLALMLTAYQPISSVAKVMGSVFVTSTLEPKEMTAASRPMPGPTSSLGSVPDA